MLSKTYFAWDDAYNPLFWLERWLNPYSVRYLTCLRGREVTLYLTRRAERELCHRKNPLQVEAQIYFSCVVKKRLLFDVGDIRDGVRVNDKLHLAFHVVQSASCDPWEFVASYPQQQRLQSRGAEKMAPKAIYLDFKRGGWRGELRL